MQYKALKRIRKYADLIIIQISLTKYSAYKHDNHSTVLQQYLLSVRFMPFIPC